MRYMIIETFTAGAEAVYARLEKNGRMLPDGVKFIENWVSLDRTVCYQLMSCDDPALLDVWIAHWSDIVAFSIVPLQSHED